MCDAATVTTDNQGVLIEIMLSQVKVQDPLVVLMSALQCFDRRAKENGEFMMTYSFEQKVVYYVIIKTSLTMCGRYGV